MSRTGNKEQRECPLCGTTVEAEEYKVAIFDEDRSVWLFSHHDAACGLPCIYGGVSQGYLQKRRQEDNLPAEYVVHGWNAQCIRCDALT